MGETLQTCKVRNCKSHKSDKYKVKAGDLRDPRSRFVPGEQTNFSMHRLALKSKFGTCFRLSFLVSERAFRKTHCFGLPRFGVHFVLEVML